MPVQTQIQVRRGTASSWTSTNPTLAAGEIGFETDTGKIKVGTGSSTWSALNYIGAANAIQYVYTASAGQTTFSGADNNSLTLSYTVGAQQVFVNGVLQVSGTDYTATNGTSITLTTATIASDIVTIVAFGTFTVADTYTQSAANATFPLNTSAFFAGKNKIINGNMVIDQRNAGASKTIGNTETYWLDRWSTNWSQASKATIQQVSDAPNGFSNSLKITSSSAATIGSGDYFPLQQAIELANAANFAFGTAGALTTTLSFYVKSSLTGTFGGAIKNANNGATYSYPFTYTINSANTWERKTVAITAPTAGNWAYYSLTVCFSMGMGSTYKGTAGTWASANYLSATGATDVLATNGATWQLTGVQLEAGSVATAFQTATGTIQGELAACQRYYQRFSSGSDAYSTLSVFGIANSTTVAIIPFALPSSMRVTPTAVDFSTIMVDDFYSGFNAITAVTINSRSTSQIPVISATSSSLTSGRAYSVRGNNSTSAYIGFSAEL